MQRLLHQSFGTQNQDNLAAWTGPMARMLTNWTITLLSAFVGTNPLLTIDCYYTYYYTNYFYYYWLLLTISTTPTTTPITSTTAINYWLPLIQAESGNRLNCESVWVGLSHTQDLAGEYFERNKQVLEKQLAKAGIRMANTFNQLLRADSLFKVSINNQPMDFDEWRRLENVHDRCIYVYIWCMHSYDTWDTWDTCIHVYMIQKVVGFLIE